MTELYIQNFFSRVRLDCVVDMLLTKDGGHSLNLLGLQKVLVSKLCKNRGTLNDLSSHWRILEPTQSQKPPCTSG